MVGLVEESTHVALGRAQVKSTAKEVSHMAVKGSDLMSPLTLHRLDIRPRLACVQGVEAKCQLEQLLSSPGQTNEDWIGITGGEPIVAEDLETMTEQR